MEFEDAGEVPGRARVRLEYLDGLRGLAALYVAVYHIWFSVGIPPTWQAFMERMPPPVYAVAVFIVLSGCCLMLPLVGAQGQMPGGTAAFFRRRARRILPPYYAAMGIALLFALFQAHSGM